jgi:hypothetical protein
MAFEFFRAESDQDREDVFRFRYTVYVEELGRYRGIADHEGRRLVEPEDDHSVIYGAREGGRVVGTGRVTFGKDGFSARQIEQYSLGPFLADLPAELLAVGERSMVVPELRGSTLNAELREFQRQDIRARGVRLAFGCCEPHLLSMNLSAGARTYAEHNINSDEVGYMIPLLWVSGNLEDLPAVPSIQQAVGRGGAVHAASLAPPETYWAQVEAALEALDQEDLHAFAGFEQQEVRDCISRSTIIECAAGDRVLKEGGSSRNLFLVLSGILLVRHEGRLLNVLGPGDVFGEMAFLLGLPRQTDIYAATPDVKIMSLSDGTLRKLMDDAPPLAAKLLFNIARMLCGRLIKANAAADL